MDTFPRLVLTLLLLILLCSTATAKDLQIVGKAINVKTGKFIYTEQHSFYEKDGKQLMRSSYLAPDNTPIGERVVVFDNDRVDSYRLSQISYPRQESVTRNQNSLAFSKDDGKKEEKTVEYSPEDEVIVGAGFSNYIKRNWDELIQGKVSKVLFASSARMNIVKLRIQCTGFVERSQANQAVAMFEMTAANPLFRMLLTPIEVGYFEDSKQIAYYKGISNLLDKNGKSFDIEIEFPEKTP